ncbi:MAG: class I SAM-dependent methyltransferase [Planctomycetota bacterium]
MGDSYQKIDIGSTKIDGTDRAIEYYEIFPEGQKPKGKSVLDLGCHIGFYCFHAYMEGASECLGIEKVERWYKQAQAIADEQKWTRVMFANGDIERMHLRRARFDIVLCLNVLHHLGTNIARPLRLMARIDSWAKERMVFIVKDCITDKDTELQPCRKGFPRRRFSAEFFRHRWPHYTITSKPSKISPNRTIISVEK